MNQLPHDFSPFIQRERQELRVEPQMGQAGTAFHFRAFHFEPRSTVRVIVKGPRKFIVCDRWMDTDEDGSIGRALTLTASRDWPLGDYTFSVDGLAMKFVLTR